jgi:hypothetical protein
VRGFTLPRSAALCGLLLLAACLMAGPIATTCEAALPASETLLPATTRLFAAIRNIEASRAAIEKTKLSKIDEDPEVRPFIDDLKKQIDARMAEAATTAGLSISDFKNLADGEVAIAVVDLGEGQTATVILADVTGHDQQLAAVRGKIATALAQKQATPTPYASQAGAQGTKYDIPPQKEGERAAVMVEAAHKTATDVMWIVSDNPAITEIVSGALGGSVPAESLAKVEAFVKIMTQTKPAEGEPAAGLAVFVDPLNLAFALRAYEYPPKEVSPDPLKVFQNAGFDGIKGIGGQVVLGVGEYGGIARAAAIAVNPRQKSLQMLSFVKGSDFAPQAWVRPNVNGYLTLYMDPLTAFDNFDPIFDGFLDDEGIWKEVKRSLKEDEDGPKIDLRDQFFALMGNRVTFVVDKKEPLTEDSAQLVVAVELKPGTEAQVKDTIAKAFANDETVEKTEVDGPDGKVEAWRVKVLEEVPPQAANQEGVVDGMRVVADALVTVGGGHLLIASDADMMQKVLAGYKDPGLAHAADFVAVAEKIGGFIEKLGKDPKIVALGFQRSDEMLKVDYELFKAGKLAKATTPLGRIVNAITSKAADEGREVKPVDTSKLPPFDTIRKYLSPMGIVVNETPDGLFATGFSLENAPPTPGTKAAAAPADAGKTPEPPK